MKKQIILGSLIALTGIANAQTWTSGTGKITTTGNVGIGTTSPLAKLDILGDLRIASSTSSGRAFELVTTGSPLNSRFKVFGDGRTYIGTLVSPTYDANSSMLTVAQSIKLNKAFNIVDNTNTSNPSDFFTVYGDGKTEIKSLNNTPFRILSNGTYAFEFMQTGQNPTMWVENTTQTYGFGMDVAGVGHIYNGLGAGNVPINKIINYKYTATNWAQVWIGDKIPNAANADFRLALDGKLVAKEIVVTADANWIWADYVFAKNYKLNSLDYLENFIKENKHLPNVPSAKDVETNGLNIAEMSKIQMEKIEELTLYVIELKKEIEAIKKSNK